MPMISIPALDEESRQTLTSPLEKRDGPARVARTVEILLLLLAAVFFALYFVHLKADFPNHSRWMDWAKYTDEGWYGDAAIRHYQLGHWNVPGDFNPGAAIPMWPLLEAVLFRFTGVSVVAARAFSVTIFGLSLLSGYLLLRRWTVEEGGAGKRSIAPAVAVLLLAANPFSYVFNRMAIVEPLLVLLTLLALLAASSAGTRAVVAETTSHGQKMWEVARLWMPSVWLGLLLPMMVLTKTTAVFLFPALLWMLWGATGYQRKPFMKAAALAGGLGASVWLAYYGLLVRPRFLADYQYLFSANGYTKVTLDTLTTQLIGTINAGTWFGTPLFGVALAAAAVAVVAMWRKGLHSNPLSVSLLLWIVGYSAFMVYHASIRSRYYLLLVTPYTLLATNVFDPLFARLTFVGRWNAVDSSSAVPATRRNKVLLDMAALVVVGALAVGWAQDARTTFKFVRHPEYTFVNAAAGVRDAIERERAAHPDHSRLLLSISGSDISLITGIPSICDDFGTMELVDRLAAYKPGWFATWNYVEDDKMDAMTPTYHLERVAAFPAFDDPDRNLLILYRLDPSSAAGRSPRPGRRRYMNNFRRRKAKPLANATPVAH